MSDKENEWVGRTAGALLDLARGLETLEKLRTECVRLLPLITDATGVVMTYTGGQFEAADGGVTVNVEEVENAAEALRAVSAMMYGHPLDSAEWTRWLLRLLEGATALSMLPAQKMNAVDAVDEVMRPSFDRETAATALTAGGYTIDAAALDRRRGRRYRHPWSDRIQGRKPRLK